VIRKLYTLIDSLQAERIMLYLPLKTEVNLYPLIRQLRKEGKTLYVPFMEGESFRLVKYRYPLKKKRFGIKEFRRVGFGKGMYDRFFEKEIKNIKTTVFVARRLCYAKDVVTDDYDVKADVVIVP